MTVDRLGASLIYYTVTQIGWFNTLIEKPISHGKVFWKDDNCMYMDIETGKYRATI